MIKTEEKLNYTLFSLLIFSEDMVRFKPDEQPELHIVTIITSTQFTIVTRVVVRYCDQKDASI